MQPRPAESLVPAAPPLKNEQEGVATSSPTGSPAIPPQAVPWLTALVAAALVSARAFPVGHPVQVAADAITDVAVLFGLASPGWRRK